MSICKKREINTIFVDSQNRLWVSFYGKGIACYSKEGEKAFQFIHQKIPGSTTISFLIFLKKTTNFG